MAKGFTVKASKPPTQQKQEWDYDAIKERMRGKAIVFCFPVTIKLSIKWRSLNLLI